MADQTLEWSDMIGKQMTEEHALLKGKVSQQSELLKTLLETAQAAQRRELEMRNERVAKDLKTKQAKASMDSVKSVMADKTIKNKAERDRLGAILCLNLMFYLLTRFIFHYVSCLFSGGFAS